MVLAMLRSNPLPDLPLPASHTLYSPCWINGRRYIQRFAEMAAPTRSYIPMCQSFAPAIFADLQDLALTPSAMKEEMKKMLVRACGAAAAEYGKTRERKSMMPESVALMEFLGQNTILYVRSLDLLSAFSCFAFP